MAIDKSELNRTWNSQYSVLAFCLNQGLEGRVFQLEAQYTVADGEQGGFWLCDDSVL